MGVVIPNLLICRTNPRRELTIKRHPIHINNTLSLLAKMSLVEIKPKESLKMGQDTEQCFYLLRSIALSTRDHLRINKIIVKKNKF